MKHYIEHTLSADQAKSALQQAVDHYTAKYAKYAAEARWRSPKDLDVAFNVKGLRLHAALSLEPSRIAVDMDVPFVLRPFKNKAIQVIDEIASEWISKVDPRLRGDDGSLGGDESSRG